MGEYTALTLISIVLVLVVEFAWLKTGIFATSRYWLSMALVFFFQALVDGWLTKLDNPIVLYNEAQLLGVRAPWDIPIEDFGFGFSMVTLTLMLWVRLTGGPGRPADPRPDPLPDPQEVSRRGR